MYREQKYSRLLSCLGDASSGHSRLKTDYVDGQTNRNTSTTNEIPGAGKLMAQSANETFRNFMEIADFKASQGIKKIVMGSWKTADGAQHHCFFNVDDQSFILTSKKAIDCWFNNKKELLQACEIEDKKNPGSWVWCIIKRSEAEQITFSNEEL